MSMTTTNDRPRQGEQLPAIAGPRLPFHPAVEQRFGIDRASWKALVEAIFPNATTTESVILALSYCRARKLDPFKKNVHIVPIWSKDLGRMVDTVWPGIGELRTTAFRTGEYAGRGETVFGPDRTEKIGSIEMTYPEWAQVTVHRMVRGQIVPFCGPRVYWLETYATAKRNDDTPNDMWRNRPRGQIDKCAEAAALRAAFPEEIGGDHIPEEVQHGSRAVTVEGKATASLEHLGERLAGNVDTTLDADPDTTAEHDEQPNDSGEEPHDQSGYSLDLATQGFDACTTAEQVDKWEVELKAMDLNEGQEIDVEQLANAARDRVSKLAKGSKQKSLV